MIRYVFVNFVYVLQGPRNVPSEAAAWAVVCVEGSTFYAVEVTAVGATSGIATDS